MTFQELSESLRSELEQLAFDAGCSWVEEFREERGRDPEPEECDEEASSTAERLARGRARRLIEGHGVDPEAPLLAELQRFLSSHFVEALEM